MALKLNEAYPGRFGNPSADYPQGSFKNRTSPTAQDGSYFEKQWANDWLGFFSSLLANAGITANGNVDKVGASQYYDALMALASTPLATESAAGKVELATQAEAESGTDDVHVPTVLRVFQALRSAAAAASETQIGTARFATQAELNAGTLSNVLVSPARLLAGTSMSTAANGYIKLPQMFGGIIIQWGSVDAGTGTHYDTDITFPLTFPNACRAVVGNAGAPGYIAIEWVVHTWILSTSQFHLQLNPTISGSELRRATWIAIGY